MSATEQLGVRVSTPGQNINLEGQSFGDLLAFEHMRVENLRRCVAALGQAHQSDGNELVGEVMVQLQAMLLASTSLVGELLRVSREQGLRFEPMPSPGDVH